MKRCFWLLPSFAVLIFRARGAGVKSPGIKAKAKYENVVDSLASIGDELWGQNPGCKGVCNRAGVVSGAIEGFRSIAPAVVARMVSEDMLNTIPPSLLQLEQAWGRMANKITDECREVVECKGVSVATIEDDLETLETLYKDRIEPSRNEKLFDLDSKVQKIADKAVSLYRNAITEPKPKKDNLGIREWLGILSGVLKQMKKLYEKVKGLVDENPKEKEFIFHRYKLGEYLQRLFQSISKAQQKIESVRLEAGSELLSEKQTFLERYGKCTQNTIVPFEELLNSPGPVHDEEGTIRTSDKILNAEPTHVEGPPEGGNNTATTHAEPQLPLDEKSKVNIEPPKREESIDLGRTKEKESVDAVREKEKDSVDAEVTQEKESVDTGITQNKSTANLEEPRNEAPASLEQSRDDTTSKFEDLKEKVTINAEELGEKKGDLEIEGFIDGDYTWKEDQSPDSMSSSVGTDSTSPEDVPQVTAVTNNVTMTPEESLRVPHITLPPVTVYSPSGKTGTYRLSGSPRRLKQGHGVVHIPTAAASATTATASEGVWEKCKRLINWVSSLWQ